MQFVASKSGPYRRKIRKAQFVSDVAQYPRARFEINTVPAKAGQTYTWL